MKDRIKNLRIKKNMTQAQLGEILGITQKAISLIEKGINRPNVAQIEMLSNYFNVSTDYIVKGIESTKDIEPIERDFLKIIRTDSKVYEALAGMLNSKNYFERMAA
jgi:transcriptional regulator with XRE-family HTH domain